LNKPAKNFRCRIEPEDIEEDRNGYGKNKIAGFNMKTFERRHIPLKSPGQHGEVYSFRSLDGSDKKDSDYTDKNFDAFAVLFERSHISGPDDPHGFFHEDKNIAIEKEKLRNKKRRNAQLPEGVANTRKRGCSDKQKRRAYGESELDQDRKKRKPSRRNRQSLKNKDLS
jgi:hypothetical protein